MYANGESVSGNGISQTIPIFNPSNFSMGLELQQQLGVNIDHLSDTQFIQGIGHDLNKALPYDYQQNWENETSYTFSTQNPNLREGNLQYVDMPNGNFNASSLSNLMSLYSPSLLANSSFPFVNQSIDPQNLSVTNELLESNIVYDSRDFHQSLGQQWEYEIGEESNRVDYKGKKGVTKPKEKIRRELVNDKFTALRNLVPNPTKTDKASIIADAINYIKELLMTKNELKIQVEKKRNARGRNKRQKTAQDVNGTITKYEADESSPLRSSWVQRKSRETEVDVRIVDDEATIKLAHKRKTNCLLAVSKLLDELQLDISHVAGGLVGDNFSFLFNTKICEESCVYASAIANKIIEVADKQFGEI